MKLTLKQQQVVWCLQNGWQLICNQDVTGAWVACKEFQFHINNGVFYRLVNLDIIYQHPGTFDWVLTDEGQEIKCKEFKPVLA